MSRDENEPTTPEIDNELLNRVYALQGTAEAAEVYDEWAASYDSDTTEQMGYVGPVVAARRLAAGVTAGETVLDAGCGTGLVGVELAKLVDVTIDGVDLSAGMVEHAARTGVYRNLSVADLSRPFEIADDSYDALICVGTLTQGHLGPEPLEEMVRVVRPGGLVVATVNEAVWEAGGFRSKTDDMARRATVRGVEAELTPFLTAENISCRLLVLEVA